METKVLKLTEQELTKLKELQLNKSNIMQGYGELEYELQEWKQRKETMDNIYKGHKKEDILLGAELQHKYGNGSINLETGEFINQ